MVTAGMLSRLGGAVDLAGNGLEAVVAFERERYDLILMDCQMPEMDGFEATRQIRLKERGKKKIPIVALTANEMVEDRLKCLDSGMDDHLPKPLRPGELIAAVERWCGGGLVKPAPEMVS